MFAWDAELTGALREMWATTAGTVVPASAECGEESATQAPEWDARSGPAMVWGSVVVGVAPSRCDTGDHYSPGYETWQGSSRTARIETVNTIATLKTIPCDGIDMDTGLSTDRGTCADDHRASLSVGLHSAGGIVKLQTNRTVMRISA